jgi:hypothetical protein
MSEKLAPVEIRIYRARRPEDASRDFQADAVGMHELGYEVVSQSWAEGRSGCLRVVALGFFGALVFKPNGSLTVTYRARKGAKANKARLRQGQLAEKRHAAEDPAPPVLGETTDDGLWYWNGERWLPTD